MVGGGDQLVINIYLVSYWKENLQFVCHPLIQVVGLVVAKHQNREREGEGASERPTCLSWTARKEEFDCVLYESHVILQRERNLVIMLAARIRYYCNVN